MNKTFDIQIALDTVCDILDSDIKSSERLVEKRDSLYQIDQDIITLGYYEHDLPIRVVMRDEIQSVQTELDWFVGRNDNNIDRYRELCKMYEKEYGEAYVPERTSEPNWVNINCSYSLSALQYEDTESCGEISSEHAYMGWGGHGE